MLARLHDTHAGLIYAAKLLEILLKQSKTVVNREEDTVKIGIAMMSHETNTFSPVITDLDRFSGGHGVPLRGDVALQTYRGTASCLGGYIEVAEVKMSPLKWVLPHQHHPADRSKTMRLRICVTP